MTTMIGLTLLLNIWSLNRILKDKTLHLRPLHSDECGGLGFLGTYSLKTVYLAVVAGLVISILEYRLILSGVSYQYHYLLIHLSVPLYIIWAIFSFLAPVFVAHIGMERAKNEEFDKISKQYLNDYSRICGDLTKDAGELEKATSKLKKLQELYELVKQFPTWPFDLRTFRKFLISTSSPFIGPFIGFIIKVVSKFFTP